MENKELYRILSKGIHSLNEKEYLQYLDIVWPGIELLPDEKEERQKRKMRITKAEKGISRLTEELQKNNFQ